MEKSLYAKMNVKIVVLEKAHSSDKFSKGNIRCIGKIQVVVKKITANNEMTEDEVAVLSKIDNHDNILR